MTHKELCKLDKLESVALKFAAQLFNRILREPLDSPDLQRLKCIANRASARAERRYQTRLKAYRASLWNEKSRTGFLKMPPAWMDEFKQTTKKFHRLYKRLLL